MICLRCGECCRTISPLVESSREPCPHLRYKDKIAFCDIYEKRPSRCYKHDYPASVCPVGRGYWELNINEAPEDFREWVEKIIKQQKEVS